MSLSMGSPEAKAIKDVHRNIQMQRIDDLEVTKILAFELSQLKSSIHGNCSNKLSRISSICDVKIKSIKAEIRRYDEF